MLILRTALLFTSMAFSLAGSYSLAISAEPMKEIKITVDGILEVLRNEEMKKPENSKKRREQIRQLISAIFNFEEMSKRSLALHWKKRSAQEKQEFTSLFKDLLERSYMNRIEAYTDENVVYTDESTDNGYAVVKTKIITEKNVEIPINYRLQKIDSKWSVYDVIIEGVSLVNNYRSQFNKIINTQSYDTLVKKMKNKQKEEKLLE